MNLTQLCADAKAAKFVAEIACQATDDGGTCNLDAVFFPLGKGVKAGPVVRAFREAGLSAGQTRWLGRGVMVSPPGTGQANKRYAANKALHQSLTASGWPVIAYHQMD